MQMPLINNQIYQSRVQMTIAFSAVDTKYTCSVFTLLNATMMESSIDNTPCMAFLPVMFSVED
ncbi:Non-structural glycoprotein [Trichinella pseudospiralis]